MIDRLNLNQTTTTGILILTTVSHRAATNHRVDRLQCFGETIDDQRELVSTDLNQAFLVLLNILNRLCCMKASTNW